MRSLVCFLLAAGLTACQAPAPSEPELSLTRKAPAARASAEVPDPFASQGHTHPVAEEPGVSYAARAGGAELFIHGRYAARRIEDAVVLTLDFHHDRFSSALLRFEGVSGPGFAKDDLKGGGFVLNGAKGEAWGLTVEKDREAFMKALTLDTGGNAIKGAFKGELRPFYGGATGTVAIAIEFETPFPAAP